MKKKDIIQLVKETVKENTFFGNREQPSQLSTGTKVSVPTDEYPFSKKPKRTATGMMEAGPSNNPYYNNLVKKAKEMGIHVNDLMKSLLKDKSEMEIAKMGYQDLAALAGVENLGETDAIATARSLRPGGEEDEEQDEYDKGWYGESLKEAASKLGYLNEAEYGKYFGGRTKGGDKEVDGMEDGEQTNQYNKAEFMYVEGNGSFYALNLYTGDGQKQKMKYDEANEWLKGQLEYIHEGDLIPRKYNSGLEDLDLIVDRLRELNIEASHNEYDFS